MYVSKRKRVRFSLKKEHLFKYIGIGCIGAVILGLFFIFILFAWYAKDLPEPGKLSQVSENATVFYDRDGKILFEMFKDKNRLPVKLSEITDKLKQATIAIED